MLETADRPTQIITINSSDTVKAAAAKMFDNKVGCLIVNGDDGSFAGIITERDIVNRLVASSADIENTKVAQIMTSRVVFCTPQTPTSKAREIMASHGIRHLPIMQNNIVIGMVSARDLLGRQLIEDRAAAEEVAMLSSCLKSIDLNEVANIVTREVPKLFLAEKCVLCFHQGADESKHPGLISSNKCVCPKEHLKPFEDMDVLLGDNSFYYDEIPNVCNRLGARSPRLVIPLKVSDKDESDKADASTRPLRQLPGYLCMCGLAASAVANKELLSYKARLAREILDSHLTNARLYQEARLTSLTDALTGVGSRKLLEDKLHDECARAKRYGRPLSLALIDLDNFKMINDVLGHATGDEALVQLAACMKEQKRTPDVLTRYGGDEFVIMMPETKTEQAVILMERLRAKAQQIKLKDSLSITISCGIAQSAPDSANTARELMRRADLALYEAKSAGRNCVKIWDKTMSKPAVASNLDINKIKKLQRRIAGLSERAEQMFIQSIWGLVQALEAKDPYAKTHSENVTRYAVGIAVTMALPGKEVEIVRRASMIHDIGKIGIPDTILSKPARLTPAERSIIEQHPIIAVRILEKMTFLEREVALVRHHHEKWNAQGYPDGLSGSSIPAGARIMAVADTFDALTSNRSYHKSRPVAQAMKILTDSSGYDFDPDAVKGMARWVANTCNQLGKPLDRLTVTDLLNQQKQPDQACEVAITNKAAANISAN